MSNIKTKIISDDKKLEDNFPQTMAALQNKKPIKEVVNLAEIKVGEFLTKKTKSSLAVTGQMLVRLLWRIICEMAQNTADALGKAETVGSLNKSLHEQLAEAKNNLDLATTAHTIKMIKLTTDLQNEKTARKSDLEEALKDAREAAASTVPVAALLSLIPQEALPTVRDHVVTQTMLGIEDDDEKDGDIFKDLFGDEEATDIDEEVIGDGDDGDGDNEVIITKITTTSSNRAGETDKAGDLPTPNLAPQEGHPSANSAAPGE